MMVSIKKIFFTWVVFLCTLFFTACTADVDMVFQRTSPSSTVKLLNLLDEVPVLKEAFVNLNQSDFNDKLQDFLMYDPETSVFMLNQLHHLIRVNNHLPKLIDEVSGILQLSLDYYQNEDNRAELNGIGKAFDQFSETEFVTFFRASRLAVSTLSHTIYSIGNNTYFFPDAQESTFVSFDVWSDCSISKESFETEKPEYLDDSTKREVLYNIYEVSRTIYCELSNLSDEKVKEFFDQESGRLKSVGMADLLLLVKSLDIESAVGKLINLMRHHRKKIISIDQIMADWLVGSPAKNNLLNYGIQQLYPFLLSENKSDLFNRAGRLADKLAPFLTSTESGGAGQADNPYLIEWLMLAFNSDLDKFHDLTDHVNLNLNENNTLYGKVDSLISSSQGSFRRVFNPLSLYHKTKLRRFLDSESYGFTPFLTEYQSEFKGLFYDEAPKNDGNPDTDGFLKVLSYANDGNYYGASYFRYIMNNRLQPALGELPLDYSNEAPMEAFLNNFYYFIVNDYYSMTDRAWKSNKHIHKEKTLPVYLSRLQYALLNLMMMNADGDYVTPVSFSASAMDKSQRVPYLTHFLHTLAGAMGYFDFRAGPAKQTLETSLRAVGSTDIADDGIQYQRKDGQNVYTAVMCKPDEDRKLEGHSICDVLLKNSIARNGQAYTITAGMPAYELLTPGSFFTRNSRADALADATAYDTLTLQNLPANSGVWARIIRNIFFSNQPIRRFHGRFSVHQGDLVSTGSRTAEWAMGQFQFFGWHGYGPFTVRGKAPNGSESKYVNSFVTDSYKAKICNGDFNNWNMNKGKCKDTRYNYYPLGNDGRYKPTDNTFSVLNDRSKEGAIKMFENIYVPQKASDHCWVDSLGDRLGYALYGYVRPSRNHGYIWNANCSSWRRIQIDFDSVEKVIGENIKWLIYHKKFVLITPNYIYASKKIALNHHGASMAIFNIAVGNGIQGFVSAKLAGNGTGGCDGGGKHRCNGRWNRDPRYNMLNARDDDGKISTGRNGFRIDSQRVQASSLGIKHLVTFAKTSFEPGDSSLIVDYAVDTWGFAPNSSTRREIFSNINRPTTDFAQALAPLLSLGKEYDRNDITLPSERFLVNMSKFKVFYERYFPDDDYDASGSLGSNNILDIYDKHARSSSYVGCLDVNQKRVSFCLTDAEMPYVPRAYGVHYPSSYDANGKITGWAWNADSELKLSAFVALLVQMMGTFHESGAIVGLTNSNGTCNDRVRFAENSLSNNIQRPNYRDSNQACIRFFEKNGFRQHISTFLTAMVSLNETKQTADGAVTPEYNAQALLNVLIEDSPGSRNGSLIKLLRNFNIGNMPYFKDELQKLVTQNIKSVLSGFDLLSPDGPSSALNKLRYFLTKNVIDENSFTSNFLGEFDIVNDIFSSQEPILFIKDEVLPYLRKVVSNKDIKNILKKGLDTINQYLQSVGSDPLGIDSVRASSLFDKFKELLHKRTGDRYYLDNILQKVFDSRYHDPKKIFELDLYEFVEELPELANLAKEFDYDFETKIFSKIFSDHRCDSSSFYDIDKNDSFDEKLLLLDRREYRIVNNKCGLINEESFYDPQKYMINIHRLSHDMNKSMKTVGSSDFDSFLDDVYSLPNNLTKKITELKDEAITTLMSKLFQEPVISIGDSEEVGDNYLDFNDDGVHGKFMITQLINFVQDKMQEYLFAEEEGALVVNKTIKGSLQATNELLNPTHPDCVAEVKNQNCAYVTSSLLELQEDFAKINKFSSENLMAFKNFASVFVYDKENSKPTYFLNTMSDSFAPMMLAYKGKYKKLIDVLYHASKPEGFFTYMSESLAIPEGYSTVDLLVDFQTLLNTKAMREYDHPETFWWQFGDIIGGFSGYVGKYYGYSILDKEDYYDRMSEVFSDEREKN